MSIKLYMVHVPYAISPGLHLRGVDVLTAQEDATTEISDSDLLDRAPSLGRALFTQDNDFRRLASELQKKGQPFAGVVRSSSGCDNRTVCEPSRDG